MIHSPWAYTVNGDEKHKENMRIYERIKNKAKIKLVSQSYGRKTYEVLENPESLNTDELALICDHGNLCFGHRADGEYIVIHTD